MKNRKSLQAIEPEDYLAKHQLDLAGLFLKTQDKNYVLMRMDAEGEHPFATVFHEYTHLQFSSSSEWMPLWLNEGIAEFFQNTDFHDKEVVLGQVSQHQDLVTAAEKAFGDLKQLQSALDFYIRQHQYKQFILSSSAAPLNQASYKVRSPSQPDYDALRADVMASVGRKKDARALLESVMSADSKNSAARETMGMLEMMDGNQEAARKWYGEAVQLDSQSYLAHYYFAALTMRTGSTDQSAQVEASLRSAIRLNPSFAPAYDELSTFYGMQHKNMAEAQSLNMRAVQLDRTNLGYRLHASNLLMMQADYDDAEKVLRLAAPLAKTAAESAQLQSRLDQIASIRKMKADAQARQSESGEAKVSVESSTPVGNADAPPRHPRETAAGPKHFAVGLLHAVSCSDPAVMDLQLEVAAKAGKKQISLYTNNYYKLDLSAAGFTPNAEMNPCKDIDGMKARVQYTDSSDKTVDGQLVAIELRK